MFRCLQYYLHPPHELPHDKTSKMTYAPSEDSDQPRHPPSLIRVFAVRMKKAWVLIYPLSAQQRLIKLGGCPGWSSLGAQSFCCFVMRPLIYFQCSGSLSELCIQWPSRDRPDKCTVFTSRSQLSAPSGGQRCMLWILKRQVRFFACTKHLPLFQNFEI